MRRRNLFTLAAGASAVPSRAGGGDIGIFRGYQRMAEMYDDNPAHSIIDHPSTYEMVRFDLHRNPEDPHRDYLDLWLRRGTEVRRLRFTRPSSVNVRDGFPQRSSGMVILDVRHWGWEDVGVAVRDFENSEGGVSFNAKDVQELHGGVACR